MSCIAAALAERDARLDRLNVRLRLLEAAVAPPSRAVPLCCYHDATTDWWCGRTATSLVLLHGTPLASARHVCALHAAAVLAEAYAATYK